MRGWYIVELCDLRDAHSLHFEFQRLDAEPGNTVEILCAGAQQLQYFLFYDLRFKIIRRTGECKAVKQIALLIHRKLGRMTFPSVQVMLFPTSS